MATRQKPADTGDESDDDGRPVPLKTCNTCGEDKPLTAFSFGGHGPPHRRSRCRDCENSSDGRARRSGQPAEMRNYGEKMFRHLGLTGRDY